MPAHQVFFHIVDAVRDAHGDQRGALSRLDRAELAAETERLGADRASRSRAARAAGTAGASARIAASSANRFRSSTLARLSVPTATRTPDA